MKIFRNLRENNKIEKLTFFAILIIFLLAVLPSAISADKSLKLNNNLTYDLGVEWSKIYGGSEWDFLFSVDETTDGGFYASGTTEISNMYYGWLMKLDSKGHIEWEIIEEDIRCSNLNYLLIYNTIQTSDAGFIICGSTRDESNNLVGFIIKYDYNGIKEWSRIYDDQDSNQITNVLEIEGGYMVIGIESYNEDYYSPLMKIDDSGFIEWRKDFNYGRHPDMFWGICSIYDDGFLLSGTAGWSQPNADIWLVKTDNAGNLIWNKSYGGNAAEEFRPNKCSISSDGGFIVGCESSSFGSGDSDGWIFKTDSDGNMVWNKTFGGESQDRIWGMDNTLDGGFIFCLNKNFDRLPNSEIDLIKLNSDGDVDWIFNYATPELCMGYQISQIIDDGFILALRINGRYGQSYADGSLVKISENINQQPVKPIQPDGKSNGKAGSEYTYSTSSSDPDEDQLYYFWDWGDGNNSGWIGPYDSGEDCSVSYSWKSNGNYSIRVKSEDMLGYESEWSDQLSVSMPKNKLSDMIQFLFLDMIKNFRYAPHIIDDEQCYCISHSILNNNYIDIYNDSYLSLSFQTSPVNAELTKDFIEEIISNIDEELITNYVQTLQDFGPKETGTVGCVMAEDYVSNELQNMGLFVQFLPWISEEYDARNIEAVLPGENDECVIISGHLDTVHSSPGADDDCTGIAAVLAAAKTISEYLGDDKLFYTIHFVAFTGKEQGLYGSKDYVNNAKESGLEIIAHLGTDMLGHTGNYKDGTEFVNIMRRSTSDWIAEFSKDVAEKYEESIGLTISKKTGGADSDYWAFLLNDYDAVFFHESYFNPYWHTPDDTIDKLDLEYDSRVTRLIVATLLSLADNEFGNQPPSPPSQLYGPSSGKPGVEYNYSCKSFDNEGDQIYFQWDWGDGSFSDWLGPYDHDIRLRTPHTWDNKGDFNVRVKAKDEYGAESDWSDSLVVSMPKKIQIIISLSDLLQEHYPRIFSLFKYYFRK